MRKDFTIDEIIKITLSLGSEDYKHGTGDELIFQTICHNATDGSYKLYYYPDSNLFHCYTGCGDSFNIYELVKRSKDYSFIEAKVYINNLLGMSSSIQRAGFVSERTTSDDWDIFEKYAPRKKIEKEIDYTFYSKSLVQYHKHLYPVEWINEEILPRSMDKFQIRYDLSNNRIIIPHFDILGNLIGIRGRALNDYEVERSGKYKPIVIEAIWY